MTIEELQNDGAFRSLTDKQKVFVTEYCTNGADKEKAAVAAYPTCKSYASRMASAHANLKVKKIAYLVNLFFGDSPENQPLSREEFLGLLASRLRDQRTPHGSFTVLVSHYLRLAPWNQPEPKGDKTQAEPETDIDELVRQIESETRK